MKQKRRFISFLLTVCLLAGLMPTAAAAADTDKALQLVDSGSAVNINGSQEDSIYFGSYKQSSDGNGGYNTDPIKWRVLSNADGKLFLLSDQNLDMKPYNSSCVSITWEKSTIRSWLNGYGANENTYGTDYSDDNFIDVAFSGGEQGAVADTYVYNATQSDGISNPNPYYSTSGGNDTTDKIFLLSIEEVGNNSYFPKGDGRRISSNTDYVENYNIYLESILEGVGRWWWLRSPGVSVYNATYVRGDGGTDCYGTAVYQKYRYNFAVRPAFNLNLNSVLFTSAAAGGKSSGTVGADALEAVSDYSSSEWKLTLLDASRSFSANVNGDTSISASAGGSVQITYSGAQEGNNEYVSALLCDTTGSVLYYGNIVQNSVSGTAALNLPSGLAAGTYTLKVFSEQCNGDYYTDFASAFQDIALKVGSLQKEPTPSAAFTATGDNSGTLSNADTSMKYSVDGGTTWNDITGETMELTGVTAEQDVKVYKPGNGTTTSDSEVQTIDVTQAAQPEGIDKEDCTTSQQNNGADYRCGYYDGIQTLRRFRLDGGYGKFCCGT